MGEFRVVLHAGTHGGLRGDYVKHAACGGRDKRTRHPLGEMPRKTKGGQGDRVGRMGRFGTVWDGNGTVLGRIWGFEVAFLG